MLLPPRFSRVVSSWLLGVALTAAATNGCNVGFGSADSISGAGGSSPGQEGDAGSFDGGEFKADGGVGLTPSLGSPLCNLTRFPACMPDRHLAPLVPEARWLAESLRRADGKCRSLQCHQ